MHREVVRIFCRQGLKAIGTICHIFFRRTGLDVLSGRHFVRNLQLVKGGYEWFGVGYRVVKDGFGWFSVVTSGYGWLRVVTSGYG